MYFRGKDGCLFVYDLTDENSLLALDGWKKELDKHSLSTSICVGNKMDLNEVGSCTKLIAMGETWAKANEMQFVMTKYQGNEM